MFKPYYLALLAGLGLLLARPAAQAQTAQVEESPWSHLIDSLTANLNKVPITSGILYDRAMPLAALPAVNIRQADTTGNGYLRQAYLELWVAAYNRSTFRFRPEQLDARADRAVRRDSVALGVLDYQFHYLDSLAVRDGLVRVQNGVLYDVAGRSRSPYLVRNLTLAAALTDTLRQATATFVLPPALLLGNRSRRVTGVTLDFNDGGPGNRFLLPGQSISITYPTNGRKVVWFIVQFDDGNSIQLRTAMYVKANRTANRSFPVRLVNLDEVEARIPFRNYDSATELFGRGEALAVLHHPTTQDEHLNGRPIKLRRPVIIMDGFDPEDNSKLFREDNSVYKLLEKQGVLTLLDDTNLQRDLIILNFPNSRRRTTAGPMTTTDVDGGADYVERNAFVLVELINRLKPLLDIDPATGRPYEFAIIGPSMGGLISRYALAYMEKQGAAGATPPAGQTAAYWQHNTATWLSFDAPHQGAVVPMGDQAYLDFFKNLATAAGKTLRTTLYSPAAKQMLVHHILAPGNTPAGAPGFRDRFMLALRDNGEPGSLGYPVHLRRVALANGRLDGQSDPGGSPGGNMFEMDIRLRTGYAIGGTIIHTLYRAFFNPFAKQLETRIAACTARYAPAPGASATVFEGVLYYGIYGVSVPPIAYTYSPLYGRRTVTSNSQGSYDLAPGGSRDTQKQLKAQAEGAGEGKPYKVKVTDVHPNHTFIPTVSALGFQYQTMSSYQNTSSLPNNYIDLRTRDLVCNQETPFDDFYAPSFTNTGHVTVEPGGQGQAFLVRELTPRVATPVFVNAPTDICSNNGSLVSFSVKNECYAVRPGQVQPRTTYAWAPGPGLQITNGQGMSTVQVQRLSNAPADTYLEVVATRAGYAPSLPHGPTCTPAPRLLALSRWMAIVQVASLR